MIKEPCILTDVARCIGCEDCVVACNKIHGLPEDDLPPRIGGYAKDGLSATRWTSVLPRPAGEYVRKQCRHCLEPACVSVCPVGALKKTPEGPVIWDNSRCIGCRYCMMSCPYGIPRFTWTRPVPLIRKCTMCYEEIQSGKIEKPACVTACPTEATIFGTRENMLAEARRRLEKEPDKYIQHIWGEYEVGGTSVLYISDVDLSFLGWTDSQKLSGVDLPNKTWEVLKTVPYEFFGMGAVMTSIWWILDRRQVLERERRAALSDDPGRKGDEQ